MFVLLFANLFVCLFTHFFMLLPPFFSRNESLCRWRRALVLRYKAGTAAAGATPPRERSDDSWFQDHRTGELFRSVHRLVVHGGVRVPTPLPAQ